MRFSDLASEPGLEGSQQGRWKQEVGKLGENLAASYLHREERMKLLYRNFRAPKGGEVDLICRDGDVLVFAEVKTRTTLQYGRPAEAVNKKKQLLIVRGALEWLRLLDHPDVLFRFDIVEVVLTDGQVPEIHLIKNAFNLPEHVIY
ncbi:MAG: YraN family protein [Verrucomicrobiales bacterium]|nr:YraN family protein [Verrucomicrobiales bacterium]